MLNTLAISFALALTAVEAITITNDFMYHIGELSQISNDVEAVANDPYLLDAYVEDLTAAGQVVESKFASRIWIMTLFRLCIH